MASGNGPTRLKIKLDDITRNVIPSVKFLTSVSNAKIASIDGYRVSFGEVALD